MAKLNVRFPPKADIESLRSEAAGSPFPFAIRRRLEEFDRWVLHRFQERRPNPRQPTDSTASAPKKLTCVGEVIAPAPLLKMPPQPGRLEHRGVCAAAAVDLDRPVCRRGFEDRHRDRHTIR